MADKDFSHRSILQKLGLQPEHSLLTINEPETYFQTLGVSHPPHKTSDSYDFIHLFVKTAEELEHWLPLLKKQLTPDGMLWVSNPKGNKDFNQNDVMKSGLGVGLVDVKVASFDENWSVMKFVYRLKDR